MIKNSIFHWYVSLIEERFAQDKEVIEQARLAEAFNGISLDLVYSQNPQLAIRLRQAFRVVAEAIVSGDYRFPVEHDDESPSIRQKVLKAFSRLIDLLDRMKFDERK